MSFLEELKSCLEHARKNKLPSDLIKERIKRFELCSYRGCMLSVRVNKDNCCVGQCGPHYFKTFFSIPLDGLRDLDSFVGDRLRLLVDEAEEMISYGYRQTSFAAFSRFPDETSMIEIMRFHDYTGSQQKDLVGAYYYEASKTEPRGQSFGSHMVQTMLDFERSLVSIENISDMNSKLRDGILI